MLVKPNAIRVLSLDAMDTLIHLREAPIAVYARIALQEFGFSSEVPSQAEMQRNFRQTFHRLELERPCFGWTAAGGEENYGSWWAELIARTFGLDGADGLPPQLAERLIDYYASDEPWEFVENQLFDTLAHFRQVHSISSPTGTPVALVITSNFDSRLRQILSRLDHRTPQLIDHFFLSGELGVQKPGTELFQLVLRHFGLEDAPERLLHIGDNLDRDVLSPQRLGAKALLYRPKGKKKAEAAGCEPERGVNSIDSIKEFLQLFPGES